MNTTWLAMGVALTAVIGLVVTLGIVSLTFGGIEFFFGKPSLKLLNSNHGENGLAFFFKWNAAKEPARFDVVKLKMHNPFGKPVQMEITRSFEPSDQSFARDVNLGDELNKMLCAQGFENAIITIEVYSSKDGVNFCYEMRGAKFLKLRKSATQTQEDYKVSETPKSVAYGVIHRDTIADTVPGKGPSLKIATNPVFAGDFQGVSAAGSAADGASAENFAVSKVWIIEGCIVCNACEDIYPEVFDVQTDTCIVRPGAPLDDGLKIAEASDACPVEVIKFERA